MRLLCLFIFPLSITLFSHSCLFAINFLSNPWCFLPSPTPQSKSLSVPSPTHKSPVECCYVECVFAFLFFSHFPTFSSQFFQLNFYPVYGGTLPPSLLKLSQLLCRQNIVLFCPAKTCSQFGFIICEKKQITKNTKTLLEYYLKITKLLQDYYCLLQYYCILQ